MPVRPLARPLVFFAAAGLAAIAAPPVFFACTGISSGYIDPGDIPSGGVHVNPGVLTCGTIPGDDPNVDGGCGPTFGFAGCCSGPGASSGGACLQGRPDAACPAETGLVTCNETADCYVSATGGLLPCCATIHPASASDAGDAAGASDANANPAGSYLSAQCSTTTPTCAAPLVQLCRTNKECPGDKCVIQLCPDGQTYEMCGLSTSPDFPCKEVVVGDP